MAKPAGRAAFPKRVLMFDLSEVPPGVLEEGEGREFPNAQAKAKAARVSPRIIARPFFVYDPRFRREVKLPAERKLLPAEDKRGYAFLDDLMQALCDHELLRHIVDHSSGRPEWYAGWHNSATLGELAWAFSERGFQVVRFTDLFDPADRNRRRAELGKPNRTGRR
jgi:hypothetical protein